MPSLLDQVVAYCGMEVRDDDVDQILLCRH